MTYKKALYFIGEVLSLSQYPQRKESVKQQIESGKINWDKIVQCSTGHMVFQALYLNLKRADLRDYLPAELVDYAAEITQLNRDRNTAIVQQAKAINTLLNRANIHPVFLKGTAHLLENLYRDIGERLVGDIDFLVSAEQIEPVAQLLIAEGYQPKGTFIVSEQGNSKHYPRMIHPNAIAALEIHWSVVAKPYQDALTYREIFKDKLLINGFFVPSYKHQALHNMMNTQINDKGLLYGKIMMRQLYDSFMLTYKPEVLLALANFKSLFYRKNLYLKLVQLIFNADHIKLAETKMLQLLMWRYKLSSDSPKINRFIKTVIYLTMRLVYYPIIIAQACYKKEARVYIYRRISDPAWFGQHLRSYKNIP